jgi:lipoic acid synthetase
VEHTGDGSFCVSPVDPGEPARVAEAVKRLGLGYVVITSVTRDDLEDGGAGQFAKTVECIRQLSPGTKVEVLIPDFCGNTAALDAVICSGPDVIAHNMETVRELYEKVRPQADYDRSLEVLRHIASRGEGNNGGKGPEGDNGPEGGQLPEGGKGPDSGKGIKCKSGVMAGVGETEAQMLRLMDDLREAGCAFLTIGQYLRPSPDNIPVEKYIEPEVFEHWAEEARARGFEFVASAPFVRSSYHAEEWTRAAAARETADEETQV